MTPEKKAQEMFDNYFQLVNYPTPNWKSVTKRCALIAVDEIIKAGKDVDEFADSYWYEVKQEIEKL